MSNELQSARIDSTARPNLASNLRTFGITTNGLTQRSLPVQLQFEIFQYLRPLDVLRLCRTNKGLRKILLNKNANALWVKVRENVVGLPKPFPGMSEPAFASLCFDVFCYTPACSNTAREILWEFKLRYCNSCKQQRTLVDPRSYCKPEDVDRHLPLVACIVPVVGVKTWQRWRILASEYGEMQATMNRLRGPQQRADFIAAQKPKIEERLLHAKRCREWFTSQRVRRTAECGEARLGRTEAVIAKLKELGYEEDLIFADQHLRCKSIDVRQLPFVRQSRPLTDQAWTRIKPKVLKYITEEIKPWRRRFEHTQWLGARFKILVKAHKKFFRAHKGRLPSLGFFATLPQVKAIMDPQDRNDITPESFDCLEPLFPDFLQQWNTHVRERLNQYIAELLQGHIEYGNGEPCELAIANIYMRITDGCIFYGADSIPAAAHTYEVYEDDKPFGDRPDDPYAAALEMFCPPSFDTDVFYIYWKETKEAVEHICRVRGRGLASTAKEMDDFNIKIVCKDEYKCGGPYMRVICGWREAALHTSHVHRDRTISPWPTFMGRPVGLSRPQGKYWKFLQSTPTVPIRAKIVPLEKKLEENARESQANMPDWYCLHCDMRGLYRDELLDHLKNKHDISEPSEKDFFLDPAYSRLIITEPVYLIWDEKRGNDNWDPRIKAAFARGEAGFVGDLPNE